jgi:hypothetical protein
MRGRIDRMRFRKLRIAWSVFWGVLTALLIVLWVRSYWWEDAFYGNAGTLEVRSAAGHIMFHQRPLPQRSPGWTHESGLITGRRGFGMCHLGFWYLNNSEFTTAITSYWFPVLLSAITATLSWIRWSRRFGLRTLLIATTLVALVLGWVVWPIIR